LPPVSRTARAPNPEELIAAAHAGCFSMQLAALLSQAGHEGAIEIGMEAKLA
jgi:organic hydroperoxide reductase OsmC/OhrA